MTSGTSTCTPRTERERDDVLRVGDNTYDADLIRQLARRDTPASIVAKAAFDVGDLQRAP